MAEADHVQQFAGGSAAWNAWRDANPAVVPDLSGAPLEIDSDAIVPDLRRCNLAECTFAGNELASLDVSGSDLTGAVFSESATVKDLKIDHDTKLGGAIFARVRLSDTDFRVDKLTGVSFFRAELTDVKFAGQLQDTKFNRACLKQVVFTDTTLIGCPMASAKVADSSFENATFSDISHAADDNKRGTLAGCDFKRCSFQDAKFNGVDLQGAQFVDSDLRRASGIVLDDNLLRGTIFSSHGKDDWSVLRRKYTGANMVFNLIALIVFFSPWILQVAYWNGINQLQSSVAVTAKAIKADLQKLPRGATEERVLRLVDRLANPDLERCLNAPAPKGHEELEDCRPVWQVLLGAHESGLAVILSILLLVYAGTRLLLTWLVAPLRDEEKRSYHTPPRLLGAKENGIGGIEALRTHYGWMMRAHTVVKILFYIAIISSAINLGPRFFEYVWLSDV